MTTEKEDLEVKLLQLELIEKQKPFLTRPASLVSIIAVISTIGALVFDAKWSRLEAKEASFTLAEARAELGGIQNQIAAKKSEITALETSIESLEASFEEAALVAEARDAELKKTEADLSSLVVAVQRIGAGPGGVQQLKKSADAIQARRSFAPIVFDPIAYKNHVDAARSAAKGGGAKVVDAELDKMRRKVPIKMLMRDLRVPRIERR